MSATCIIALDLGTSGAKAVLHDREGVARARSVAAYSLDQGNIGRSEQDGEAIWAGACRALRELTQQHPEARQAEAIALSSQMYSLLLLDGSERPMTPSLTWADVRASGQAARLRADPLGRRLHALCGCPRAAIYPLAKLRWFSDQGWLARATRAVSVKELVWRRLGGGWEIDASLASATGAFHLADRAWHAEALEWAGVRRDQLSTPVDTRHGARLGSTAAAATGLPMGLPLIIGAGDGPLATLGCGAARSGIAACNAGTSAAVRAWMPTPRIDPHGALWTYLLDGDSAVCGGIVVGAGSLLDWLRRLGGGLDASALDDLAANAGPHPPRAQIWSAGPHAPDWDDAPRFSLAELRPDHGPGEIAAALLDAIADALGGVLESVSALAGPVEQVMLTGSVGRSAAWLPRATRALGRTVTVTPGDDASARGAALLGLAAIGALSTPAPLLTRRQEGR